MDRNTYTKLARNMIPAALSMATYAITLIISLRLLARGIDDRAASIAISLGSMIPALLLCMPIVGITRRSDEMQRRLQLEAFAFGFAGTALATFSYGFLEKAGFPRLSAFTVWPVMCGLWLTGVLLGHLRYR